MRQTLIAIRFDGQILTRHMEKKLGQFARTRYNFYLDFLRAKVVVRSVDSLTRLSAIMNIWFVVTCVVMSLTFSGHDHNLKKPRL